MNRHRTPARARRALIVVHSYYLRDTRPRRIATALARAGWQVDVLCARDDGEPAAETIDGVSVRRLPARRRRASKLRYVFEYVSFALAALAATTAQHLRRRYRVVYVIGIPNFLVFSAVVPRLLGARVILDMRDPLPEFYRAKFHLQEGHPLVRALIAEERASARFASRVVTVHPSMAALYARTGIPAGRITVIWNAPDPALFGRAVPRDPKGRTLLYAGTVAPRYGVDLAVRAVARLAPEIPGIRLRIVGDGDLLPALRKLAHDEGIADRISFDGPVPLDRIPEICAGAWLGVQPNRADPLMRYSFSAKILEWCLLGLPVVCGATDALRETFAGDDLLIHAPGDLDDLCARILEADRDPEELARRRSRARAVAAAIRYEDQVARLVELFEGRGPVRYNSRTSDENR
ncbi:MAG: glycosyltransferase [Acidobacteria bacterium]|nr:glycosyltransferase [Acidobacteriota bacterium]